MSTEKHKPAEYDDDDDDVFPKDEHDKGEMIATSEELSEQHTQRGWLGMQFLHEHFQLAQANEKLPDTILLAFKDNKRAYSDQDYDDLGQRPNDNMTRIQSLVNSALVTNGVPQDQFALVFWPSTMGIQCKTEYAFNEAANLIVGLCATKEQRTHARGAA